MLFLGACAGGDAPSQREMRERDGRDEAGKEREKGTRGTGSGEEEKG